MVRCGASPATEGSHGGQAGWVSRLADLPPNLTVWPYAKSSSF